MVVTNKIYMKMLTFIHKKCNNAPPLKTAAQLMISKSCQKLGKQSTSGSLAAVWVVVIVSFLVLMLSYTTFYGVIVDALYQMVAYYTGGQYGNLDAANKVRVFFTLFPRFFMPAVLLWAFMMSFRRERDDYRMQ